VYIFSIILITYFTKSDNLFSEHLYNSFSSNKVGDVVIFYVSHYEHDVIFIRNVSKVADVFEKA